MRITEQLNISLTHVKTFLWFVHKNYASDKYFLPFLFSLTGISGPTDSLAASFLRFFSFFFRFFSFNFSFFLFFFSSFFAFFFLFSLSDPTECLKVEMAHEIKFYNVILLSTFLNGNNFYLLLNCTGSPLGQTH